MHLVSSLQSSSRSPLLQVLKTSAAAVISWLLSALLLEQALPIFAAIAALLVVQPSVTQSLAKGIERSVGVVLGVVVAAGLGFLFGSSSWVILVAIVAALLLAWSLKLGPGSANQIPISAMLVLALGSLTPAYAVDRIIETIIGAGVGLAVNAAIVPPVLSRPAHLAVMNLVSEVAAALDTLAATLSTPGTSADRTAMLTTARTLREVQESAKDAVARGEESLTLNPRGGRHRRRLEQDKRLLARLTVLVTRVLGMTRAVRDHYDDSLIGDPAVAAIATELHRAAHDLRLLSRETEGAEAHRAESAAAELPALTAPLVISRPHPQHWILIGSLLEDMRRVREEIVSAEES